MKKTLALIIAVALMLTVGACASPAPVATPAPAPAVDPAPAAATPAPAPAEPATPAEPAATEAAPSEPIFIPVISKGFQHKFWQTVKDGADKAANDNGVTITFDGPPSESDISAQVDMINAALAQNPKALCLAALDTESVTEQLNTCIEKGIPVIGFDSGVPNAPAGSIVSTASTDNEAAGALAAQTMFDIETINAAIKGASASSPVVLSVISQDATSASVTGRTSGFVDKMFELCEGVQAGLVAVTGHDTWNKASTSGDVAVEILVSIAASPSVTDCQTAAQAVIQRTPVAVFCTNSGSVDGMLAATSDGSDLDRENGRYKDLILIGFDSGAPQLTAVKNKWFHGAVTQDPYMIGYNAVDLAVKVLNGETVPEIVDTGCQYYTAENMDDPAIAALLYE